MLFIPGLITGCGAGGGDENSTNAGIKRGVVATIDLGAFEEQKYEGQIKIVRCPIRALIKTKDGLMDISPGMIPKNFDRVNTDIFFLPLINRPELGTAKSKDSGDPPGWEMYQTIYKPDTGGNLSHLY